MQFNKEMINIDSYDGIIYKKTLKEIYEENPLLNEDMYGEYEHEYCTSERFVDIMQSNGYNIDDEGDILKGTEILNAWSLNYIILKKSDVNYKTIYSIGIYEAIEFGMTEEVAVQLRKYGWYLEDEEFFAKDIK